MLEGRATKLCIVLCVFVLACFCFIVCSLLLPVEGVEGDVMQPGRCAVLCCDVCCVLTLSQQALQQQAEGLIAAISRNTQNKSATQQELAALQQQLEEQQAQHATAREQLLQLQEQHQQAQQRVADAEQQLAEVDRQKQAVAAEVADKQHSLQVTRGECAAAQDKLSQVCVGWCVCGVWTV